MLSILYQLPNRNMAHAGTVGSGAAKDLGGLPGWARAAHESAGRASANSTDFHALRSLFVATSGWQELEVRLETTSCCLQAQLLVSRFFTPI